MSDTDIPVDQLPDDPAALIAALAAPETPPVGVSPWMYVLGAVALILVLLLAFLLIRAWQYRRRMQAARAWQAVARRSLADLHEQIAKSDEIIAPARCAQLLGKASVLARQIALVAEPRASVATLTGEHWLARLDQLSGGDQFTVGAGRLLATEPYQRSPQHSRSALLELADAIEGLIDGVAERQSKGSIEGLATAPVVERAVA